MVINREKQQQHCASFLPSNNSFQKQPKFKADDSIIVQKNDVAVLFHLSDWEGNHLVLTAFRTESLTY